MDSRNNNYEVIYCPEDDENRVYCDISDELCLNRFYKNHFKSQTHTNIIRKKTNQNNENRLFSLN